MYTHICLLRFRETSKGAEPCSKFARLRLSINYELKADLLHKVTFALGSWLPPFRVQGFFGFRGLVV